MGRGRRGGALRFDGTGGYVEMDTCLPELAVPLSIAFWVNPAKSQVPNADILGNHGEGFLGLVVQQEQPNTNAFGFGYGDGTRWQGTGPVKLAADAWQHVAVVCDGRHAVIYVNGVEKSRAPPPARWPSIPINASSWDSATSPTGSALLPRVVARRADIPPGTLCRGSRELGVAQWDCKIIATGRLNLDVQSVTANLLVAAGRNSPLHRVGLH